MMNTKKVLFTAFLGINNASKIILDKLPVNDKLYLKNSYSASTRELIKIIQNKEYDFIVSIGQAPLKLDTIRIEILANGITKYQTTCDYNHLFNEIPSEYTIEISDNAGNYLCNNLYFEGLKYIEENHLKTKMIFIHVPKHKNISDIEMLSKLISQINIK